MPLFSSSTPFDNDVEKITGERNTSEDWGLIMDLCDRVTSARDGPKDCLRAVSKRLNHQDPHVVMQAIVLLDACVNNCGKPFKLEVASREFEQEFKKLLARSHPKVKEKLKGMLKKWAEQDFKGDPQLNLIPSLYQQLRREGEDFSTGSEQRRKHQLPKDPNVVSSQQEEDDIAKAIQLSLQEKKGAETNGSSSTRSAGAGGNNGGLYGNLQHVVANANSVSVGADGEASEPKKARALYDFEAAEDNELTFMAGEVVLILDDSDVNWWKGSNHRGEGLFPSNFVTKDLENRQDEKRRRSVQFNEEVEVKTVEQNSPTLEQPTDVLGLGPVFIDEGKIDRVLSLLNDSDPTCGDNDDPGLIPLEGHVNHMGPLIDTELEKVDRRLAQLTLLSTELVDALNLYHQLMKELPGIAAMPAYGTAVQPAAFQQQHYSQPPANTPPYHHQPYAAGASTVAPAVAASPGQPQPASVSQPPNVDPAAAYMWQQQMPAQVPGTYPNVAYQPTLNTADGVATVPQQAVQGPSMTNYAYPTGTTGAPDGIGQ